MTTRSLGLYVRLIFVAAISLACAGASLAQGGQYLEVIPLSDLDYGTVTDVSGPVSVDNTYPYVGKFKIRARLSLPPGSFPEVDLTFLPPAVLDGDNGTIPYTMEASTNSQADNPSASSSTNGTTARIPLEIYEGMENGLPVYSAYAYVFGTIAVTGATSGGYVSPLELEAETVFAAPPACLADEWRPDVRYLPGDIVTFDGSAWEANRSTRGREPGSSGFGDEDDEEDEDEDDDEEDDDEEEDGGGNGNRVTICHIPQGNPSNQQTMTVSQNALATHLAHGDHEGPCIGGGDDDDGDDDDGGFGPRSHWDLITICF